MLTGLGAALTRPGGRGAGYTAALRGAGTNRQATVRGSYSVRGAVTRAPVYVAGGDLTRAVIGLYNWSTDTGVGESVNAMTFTKVALEKDGQNQIPITFSGGRQVTVDGKALVLSDEFDASSLTGGLARGTLLWVRCAITLANTADKFPLVGVNTSFDSGAYFGTCDPTVTDPATKIDATGAIETTGLTTRNNLVYQAALLGYHAAAPNGWLIVGDSKAMGTGDDYVPVTNKKMVLGPFERAAHAHAGGVQAYMNCAMSGVKLQDFDTGYYRGWLNWAPYYNTLQLQPCLNDLPSRSVAQILSNDATIAAAYRAAAPAGRKVIRYGCGIKRTSTDNWATVANQGYFGGEQATFEAGGKRDQLNAALAPLVGSVYDYFEPLRELQDAADGTAWVVDGNAYYATSDGTHDRRAAITLYQGRVLAGTYAAGR